MHIICIGWLYVILMVSMTASTLLGGILSFIFFGLAPVFLLGYLFRPRRRPSPMPESAESEETPPNQPPPSP